MRIPLPAVLVCVTCAFGHQAHGLTFTASGAGDNPGETLRASATFTVSNLDLVVSLSNDANFDPNDDADILTGVFFTIAGDPHLMPVSAELGNGSSVIAHKLPAGFTGDVGAQWAYRNALVGAPEQANEGISSTSLKWFKNKDVFPGAKLKGASSFGGISFGLTTLFDLPGNNRSTIKNQALVQNDIVFTFTDLPPNFDMSDISNITFQYGKTFKNPEQSLLAQPVAEPPASVLVALALFGFGIISRRSSGSSQP